MTKKPSRPVFATNGASKTGKKLPYRSRQKLLSDGERRFYKMGLKPAVGDRYEISMKVSLTDLITVVPKLWDTPAGYKIRQRHVDFVLCSKRSLRIVAAIELDDASHLADEQRRKDEFLGDALRAAGIPLIRFPIYRKYDPHKIGDILAGILTRNAKKLSNCD